MTTMLHTWLFRLLGLGALAMLGGAAASGTGAASGAAEALGRHVSVQSNAACIPRGCHEFGGSYAEALVVRPDGAVILGGSNNYIGAGARGDRPAGALAEIDSEGSPNLTFGEGRGVESVPFAVKHLYELTGGGLLALGTQEGKRFNVAEYSAAGTLNIGFGTHGQLTVTTPPGLVDVRRESNGSYVALGGEGEGRITVARYLASGKADIRFGHSGSVRLPFRGDVTPIAFASLKDHAIAVLGRTSNLGGEESSGRLFLACIGADGRVERAFGNRGIAYLPIAHAGSATVAGVPSGGIVVASGVSVSGKAPHDELVAIQYSKSGTIERSFGDHGLSRSIFSEGKHLLGVSPTAIGFSNGGQAIVVGERHILTVDVPRGMGFIAKYTARGRDCAFGSKGIVVDGELGGAEAVSAQPNESITVAGWNEKAFAAVRYVVDRNPHVCRGE